MGQSISGTRRTWQQVRTISASLTEVNVASFSPDGKTLATVDDDGKLKLWDTATGQCVLDKVAHIGNGAMAQFTPDGKSIVTAGRTDGSAKIWDSRSGEVAGNLRREGRDSLNGRIDSGPPLRREVNLWSIKNRTIIGSFAGGAGSREERSLTMGRKSRRPMKQTGGSGSGMSRASG